MLKLDRDCLNNAMAKKMYNATDLARAARLSDATISRTLKNNAIYSVKTLGKIARALDVKEPKDLLKDE